MVILFQLILEFFASAGPDEEVQQAAGLLMCCGQGSPWLRLSAREAPVCCSVELSGVPLSYSAVMVTD